MKNKQFKVKNLAINQICLCQCPDWCSEGFQVARWDGEKFDYDSSSNPEFDGKIIGFVPLDEDGLPMTPEMNNYPQ